MISYLNNLRLKRCTALILIVCVSCCFVVQVFFYVDVLPNNDDYLPIQLWWTPFMPNNDRIISCFQKYKCLVTANRTYKSNTNLGAYLFYGSRIENDDFPLPRNNNIPWAIFHEESPKNYAPFLYKETQDLFNVSSTFSRYSDFPVTLQYLDNLNDLTDVKYFVPINVKNELLKDISPVLYIQSDCDTPLGRDYLVENLMKYIKIDSYGKCLTNRKFPEGLADIYPLDLYNEEILQFISKYKFILAFENSICDDYITEKLWRALIVGSIPVYLGSPTIEDWLPNNNSAILVKNFKDLKDVGELIQRINQNDTLYESYLEHKIHSKITNNLLQRHILSDHPITAFECFVCEKIHDQGYNVKRNKNIYNCPEPVLREHKNNTWNQHWEVGKYQSKALKKLVKGQPYSSKIFDETWKKFLYNR